MVTYLVNEDIYAECSWLKLCLPSTVILAVVHSWSTGSSCDVNSVTVLDIKFWLKEMSLGCQE